MPQIQVFQCPACGANLSYDGGPEVTFACQFCGTSVVVPETLRPKEARQSAAQVNPIVSGVVTPDLGGRPVPNEKLAELQRLAQSGQKVQAIKLYREIFDTSLTQALQAVEKLAAGQPLVVTSTAVSMAASSEGGPAQQMAEVIRLARAGKQVEAVQLMRQLSPNLGLRDALNAVNGFAGREPAPSAPSRSNPTRGRAAGCGCLSTGLLVGGILAFVVGMVYVPFRLSGSYKQALEAAKSDPAVVEALGAPIQEAWWWPGSGEISCGRTCSANYEIPVYGSRKSGHIQVMSDSKGAGLFNEGTWVLDAVVVVDGGPTVELTPPPPPEPTLSALQVDATQGAASRSTQRAQSTQKAEAVATQSARRDATAAAKVAQTATAEVEAKATGQAVIAAQSSWPVSVSDTFADNHLGWPMGAEKGSIAITTTMSGKKYIWEVAPIKLAYGNAFPLKTKPLTDFAASVYVRFVRGGGDGESAYGLVFRHAGQGHGFFGIGSDGHYWVDLGFPSGNVLEGYGDNSNAIHAQMGQVNKLTVRALGSDLVFLINDQVVSQLSQELPEGDVGLGVDFQSSDAQPARVEFTNFEVRAPK